MPSISATVAQVKPRCPCAAWRAARAVHLCALTCGRSRSPGSACRHGAQVRLEPGRLDDQRRRRELLTVSTPGRLASSGRGGRVLGYCPRDEHTVAGDACSLVDAFRAKELSPLEALDDCIARHRGVAAQCLLPHRLRAGTRGRATGRRRRCPSAGALRGQGARAGAGLALHRGVDDLQGPRRRPRRHVGLPAAGDRARSWPRRPRHRSSAASTAPRPSSMGRRAIPGTSSAPPAARRGVRRRRSPAACCRSPRGATGAGRSGARPASAACSG